MGGIYLIVGSLLFLSAEVITPVYHRAPVTVGGCSATLPCVMYVQHQGDLTWLLLCSGHNLLGYLTRH
ncbi:MAG: hypothetical protein ACTJLL_02820 [Anaplasma sp.]